MAKLAANGSNGFKEVEPGCSRMNCFKAGAVEQGAESVLSDVDRLFVHM